MKVLTIKQPWATLIMQGNKRFEFRSWQTKYRGDLLIHAGKGIDKEAIKRLSKYIPEDLPAGKILGKVTLVDCVKMSPEFKAMLLKENKDIIFHIVGDGLSKEICSDMAKKYKLNNVIFYGYHPVEMMKEYYELADAFIITMTDNEVVNTTLPAKIQSYMLAGKPIFGAINGEVKEVVNKSPVKISLSL